MRIGKLTLAALSLVVSSFAAQAEGPGSLTPLFANNDNPCIPSGINDLPAYEGNLALNGSCKVSVVVSGKVKDISDYYFSVFQKRGWLVANRVQREKETEFTAQSKKQLFSVKIKQLSADNTEIEFSY